MNHGPHMTFDRLGRALHLRLDSAEALANAPALDEALWVANNAPVQILQTDATLLESLDADRDGRITCRDLSEAIEWLLAVLSDHSDVSSASDALRISALAADHPDAGRIAEAAGKILHRLGAPEAGAVTLDQVRAIKRQVEARPVSEAGVVTPAAAEGPAVRAFIADAVAATGGAEHPSGQRGLNEPLLDRFVREVRARLEWLGRGAVDEGATTDIMPLGPATPAAFDAYEGIRAKLDQYFAQCEAMALDERFRSRMGITDAELAGLDFDDPAAIQKVLAEAPIAPASAEGVLHFDAHINPHDVDALARFREAVMQPILGDDAGALDALAYRRIAETFAPHRQWRQANAGAAAAGLSPQRLGECLQPELAEAVRRAIAASSETALVLENIRLLEKAILYQANLLELANNFVSFPHLYAPARRALFEMGTLVMDGRRFNLAVRADNRTRHAELAATSGIYMLYVEVAPAGGAKYELAVPVTAGGKGNLCLGKRGVFIDRTGRQIDAVVVHVIENPISMREAVWAPFRRLGRMITGKIESLSSETEKQFEQRAGSTLEQATAAQPTAAAPAPPEPQRLAQPMGALMMGGGVALAAIGSAAAYITKTLGEASSHARWIALASLGGAILAVVGMTALVAWLRLRRRDLSAVLEGSGWGINARMRLTRKLARQFTRRPRHR